MPSICSGSTVLVTGSAGFCGAWVVRALLEAGYTVRGQVHSESTGAYLRNLFDRFGSNFETVVVKDLTQGGVFDRFLENVDAIVHTDGNISASSGSDDVRSIKSLLASAIGSRSTIKRIILLPPTTAIESTPTTGEVFLEEGQDGVVIKRGKDLGNDVPAGWAGCNASKTLAEKVAWELYRSNQRSVQWDLAVLNPPCVIGPSLHEVNTVEELPSSCSAWYNHVIKNTDCGGDMLTGALAWVDVRDLALAHVIALEQEEAGNERIIVSAGSFAWRDWVEAAKRVGPLVGFAHTREGCLRVDHDPSEPVHRLEFNNSQREMILAMGFRTMDETAADMLVDFTTREWIPLGSVELIMLECLISSKISHL